MKWFKRFIIALFSLALLGIGSIFAAYFYVLPELPDVTTLKDIQLQTPLRIYSSDGKLISQFGEKRRIPLKLEEVPKPLIQAFLATEDTRFYEHKGIDPIGVVRAALVMIATGEKKQGASTITMQVARNFFLTRDKTIIRKVKEIFISLHIEELLTKDEILELYVNRIYLGQRAYGVGAAAQVYFGKEVQNLTLAEMAVIAGLPKAPSTLNPITSATRALARRNLVLMRMHEVGFISQFEYQDALSQPITSSYHGAEIDLYAPYISEMARDYMVQKYGEEAAYTNGYNVYTTISSDLQLMAQEALRDNVFAYDERHGYRGAAATLWTTTQPSTEEITSVLNKTTSVQGIIAAAVLSVSEQQARVIDAQGQEILLEWPGLKWARKFINDKRQGLPPKLAADILTPGQRVWIRHNGEFWQLSQIPEVSSATVSLEPSNGAIRTLVGGFSFSQSQYNRVTQAKRQLGSNIKPFIYATTLEKGYTLATLINNAPINKPDTRQGTAWRPKNSPDIYGGPTRLRVGLAQSINVMSVRAMRHVGIPATIKKLTEFGFDASDLPSNESLALGSPSVSPLQVATAFNVFANGGYLVEPYFIDKVTDAFNTVIEEANPTLACTPTAQPSQSYNEYGAPITPSLTNQPNQCGSATSRFAPQVITEQTAFLITEALKSVIWGGGDWKHGTGWQGTAWRAARLLKRHDIAGKTGTTNEARDTWFSGFSPTLTSTFWVGFDDHGRQLGRTSWMANGAPDQITAGEAGAKTAGPGWNDFMNKALKGVPEASVVPPKGIVSARIDLATGKLTRKTDHTTAFEYFAAGTEPKEYVADTPQNDTIFTDNPAEDLFQ
ncbi:penicillin-binding protein 1A [Shewanella sp.]|uniref:penicillin-binding protein 1A n=1 Tax=Shewanella sp. TaxID=50422 RepID=UPI004053BE8E